MQFVVKRDNLLRSLNFVQGVVEKKNTLPILSNVLLQLKDKKLLIVATDLDIIFYDEILDVKIINEGSTTTSAAILYDILRKISSNSELNFDLKSENKLSLKSENADFNLLCLPTDNFPSFADKFDGEEISINNSKFLKLLNKTKISISNDDTRHYLNGIFIHLTEEMVEVFWLELQQTVTDYLQAALNSIIKKILLHLFYLKNSFSAMFFTCREFRSVKMQISENKIKFSIGKTQLISKVIDGKFPDYKKVVPTNNEKILMVPSKNLFLNRASCKCFFR